MASELTKQRLLEAAGEVFAERGFQAATIKEICQKAEANIAAVNYHFKDKNTLYAEVLQYSSQRSREKYPPPAPALDKPAEERLREFIRSFLLRILDTGRPAWHGKLMSREMVEPTAAFDNLIRDAARPQSLALRAIIGDLAGDKFSADEVALMAASVIAQCVFYSQSRAVVVRLYPQIDYTPESIARAAAHVIEFSLAAIRGLKAAREAQH